MMLFAYTAEWKSSISGQTWWTMHAPGMVDWKIPRSMQQGLLIG
jgi:hypothetical protein